MGQCRLGSIMALAVALLIGSLALATTAVLPPDELWLCYALVRACAPVT